MKRKMSYHLEQSEIRMAEIREAIKKSEQFVRNLRKNNVWN